MNPSMLANKNKKREETDIEKIHTELINLYINIELKRENNVSLIIYVLDSKYNSRNFSTKIKKFI